jgi:tRNA(Ile)-lysidine synthase
VIKQFEINITSNELFRKTDKLLIAFSGGVDSVVLTDLLYKSGYNIELAHCNFQLRGHEANDDTNFCENYANSLPIPIHVSYFDTKAYAVEHKLSIQMAARELRYTWFNELIEKNNYSAIITAHHANDAIETLFVNLIRGTGIKGLQGIPLKQNKVVRPLLFTTKEDIKLYAIKNKLAYREDSSNQEIKYKRNFIRHQIIPKLKELNPALEETFATSIHFFKQSSEIVKQFADLKFKQICNEKDNQLFIDINLLVVEPQKETLLFEWLQLKKFKTSQIRQLCEVLQSEKNIGKQFSSPTHQLIVDRKFIIVQPITQMCLENEFVMNSIDDIKHLPINLTFEEANQLQFSCNKNEIMVAYDDELFPLKLRHWKTGDKFKPLGLNGFKKLSDFFKDIKLSRFEKQSTWILESNKHIIWIVGYRMDDRCKLDDKSNKFLRIFVK